jgi:hypothetical protein
VRLEALAGLSLTFGDVSVGPPFNVFASLGVGVVFDTWGAPAAEAAPADPTPTL